jgi:hypothetical protein
MALRNKIYFIILGIVAQLLFVTDIRAEEVQPSDNATGQEVVTAPEQHKMSLISFQPWVVEGEVLGAVAEYVYDDVTTARAADYWELYNNEGDVLAVGWFDRFGIQRTAIDRGIVEQKDKLEGIFVVVVDGDLL